MLCFLLSLRVRSCQMPGLFPAGLPRTRWPWKSRKPAESRARAFGASPERRHKNDSKSYVENRSPGSTGLHGTEWLPHRRSLAADAEAGRPNSREFQDAGDHLWCSSGLDGYGNKSARISSEGRTVVLATVNQVR